MANIVFTQNLKRHVDCPDMCINAATLKELLELYFQEHPKTRSYILDEEGALRKHMTAFIDGYAIKDRNAQSDRLEAESEVYVIQALSGG